MAILRTRDLEGRLVALFNSEHELNFYAGKFPDITFKKSII